MFSRSHFIPGGWAVGLCGAVMWGGAGLAQETAMSGLQKMGGGELALQFSGPPGELLRIDVSPGLPDWEPFLTVQGTGSDSHLDTAAPFRSHRLYRAVRPAEPDGLTGDHIPTADGDVLIHPLVHASFLLQWNGLTIYNDPDSPADYTGLPPADLILISHSHGDHFDQGAIAQVLSAETVILAPQAVRNAMNPDQMRQTTVMGNGSTQQVFGINVIAVPAHNPNHPVGTGNGYVITLGGKRFYLSGDTGDIAEMRALQDIDVAFVCMNLPFTMSVDTAASAIREFQPAIVYPYHYRNSDGTFADFNRLKALIGTDLNIEVRLRDWY